MVMPLAQHTDLVDPDSGAASTHQAPETNVISSSLSNYNHVALLPWQAWASQLDEVPQQPVPEATRGEAIGPCRCYTNESAVSRLN
jgi:hypothetical protein